MSAYFIFIHFRTYNLHLCNVLFPPDISLVLRTESRHQVVRIHHDVYDGIDEAGEDGMAAGQPFGTHPRQHHHAGVMVHMQKGYLSILFAQNKKYGVGQIGNFQYEIRVNASCNFDGNRIG